MLRVSGRSALILIALNVFFWVSLVRIMSDKNESRSSDELLSYTLKLLSL